MILVCAAFVFLINLVAQRLGKRILTEPMCSH